MSTTYSAISNVACDRRSTAGSLGRISGHSNFSIRAQDGVSAIDVVALVDPRQQRRRHLPRRGRHRFDIAQLELGHAAAGGINHLGLDAVAGQHRARRRADIGVVEVHEAGGVEHRLALAEGGRRLVERRALARGADFERLAGVARQAGAVMDAGKPLDGRARQLVGFVGRPVGEPGGEGAQLARCGRCRRARGRPGRCPSCAPGPRGDAA